MSNTADFNVENIMADIRKKIKDENLTYDALSFDDVPLNRPEVLLRGGYDVIKLQRSTEYVSAMNQINCNTAVQGNPVKRFVKKLIRKFVQFYVVPIIDQQNMLNRGYSDALQEVNGFICKAAENDPGAMALRIEELELKQLYNKKEIAELSEQVRLLKKELAELRKV